MILICVSQWLGPSRDASHRHVVESRLTESSFASYLPIPEALAELAEYQWEYNKKFYPATEVKFELRSICEIGDAPVSILETLGVDLVETLRENLASGEKSR